MKILIVSRSPWRMDNSFGNTYSNIFKRMENVEIANIFLCDGAPDFCINEVEKYFQIRESDMLHSFKHFFSKTRYGEEIFEGSLTGKRSFDSNYDRAFKSAQKKRWSIYYIFRELIWKFGRKNWEKVFKFVEDFSPDIIFMPLYYTNYTNKFVMQILKKFNIPLVMEVSIDVYTLKQISFDPFYWLNRISIRRTIRKVMKKCSALYVISEKQKIDYDKIFKKNCKILYKFLDQDRLLNNDNIENGMFVFTGNVGNGRWKTLAKLGREIKKNNLGQLHIYTPTPLTNRMKKELSDCTMHEPISGHEVVLVQNNAKYLVHVESFSLKDKLEVRYSISTKIMDYLSLKKTIIAIGPNDIASIQLLSKYEKAHVCTNANNIDYFITHLQEKESDISMDLTKFDRKTCQNELYKTLEKVSKGGNVND